MSTDHSPEPGGKQLPDKTPGPDEKQMAEALNKSFAGIASAAEYQRLAHIVDLLPCYVALIDKEHRIRFHNRAFEQYFGAPCGKLCYKAMRQQDGPCRFCPPLECLGNRGTSLMEWVHPGTGHAFRVYSYPFIDEDGAPCVLEAGFNITASVRVQQALDLSEQSYRAITDNLSIGIALVDPALRIKTGNIRLSLWFAEGFRLDRQVCELLRCGEFWERAAREQGYTCPECPFKASLLDGAGHEKELAVTFQDGKERILRLVTCPVKPGKSSTRKPQVRALIMMLEDITNRLRVNQQLQRARKLEAMSTLAGGIAHEINQPLSALHLYASGLQMLLEKKTELPVETTQERLNLIMHEADKIRGIITHMRALVMQEGKVPLAAVPLHTAVESVLELMRHQTSVRDVTISVEVPADLPLVRSNALQLEQVLVNLLANALHALDADTPEHTGKMGRNILIRAYPHPESDRVRLEVADSGPGLSSGSERIFDPFYTTKERHLGMGLGLSIVHGLVSLWGGEISAAAHHPQYGGAVFYVDFRKAGPEDEAADSGETAEAEDLSVTKESLVRPKDALVVTGDHAGSGLGSGPGPGADVPAAGKKEDGADRPAAGKATGLPIASGPGKGQAAAPPLSARRMAVKVRRAGGGGQTAEGGKKG